MSQPERQQDAETQIRVVAAMPGGDWNAYTVGFQSYSVLAWLVCENGHVEPIALDGNGRAFRPRSKPGMFLHRESDRWDVLTTKRERAQKELDGRAAENTGGTK